MAVTHPSLIVCTMLLVSVCGCSGRMAGNTDTELGVLEPVIQLHGKLGMEDRVYAITVWSDGNIVYSNYPIPVVRKAIQQGEVIQVLREMHKAGFWSVDTQALSNATSDAFVNDATKTTLSALSGRRQKGGRI